MVGLMMVITEVAKIVVRQGGVKRRDLIAETKEIYRCRKITSRGTRQNAGTIDQNGRESCCTAEFPRSRSRHIRHKHPAKDVKPIRAIEVCIALPFPVSVAVAIAKDPERNLCTKFKSPPTLFPEETARRNECSPYE